MPDPEISGNHCAQYCKRQKNGQIIPSFSEGKDTPQKEAGNRVTLAFALLSYKTLDGGAPSDSFLLCKNRLMPPPAELLGLPVTVLGMRMGSLFGIFVFFIVLQSLKNHL